MPDDNEGLREKSNANNFLARLINEYVAKEVKGLSILLISNDFLIKKVGHGLDKYEKVNLEILNVLQIISDFRSINFEKGSNKDIDINDIRRVLFSGADGFLDIRKINLKRSNNGHEIIDPSNIDVKKMDFIINTESLLFGDYSLKTAYNFIGYVQIPNDFNDKPLINQFIDTKVKDNLYSIFNTTDGLLSYGYSKTDKIDGYILVSGFTGSKQLRKEQERIKKEVSEFQEKMKNRKMDTIEKIVI
jgi:hypothetical protein